MLHNVYISLPYIMAARTAGIDKTEEITSLSISAYNTITYPEYIPDHFTNLANCSMVHTLPIAKIA